MPSLCVLTQAPPDPAVLRLNPSTLSPQILCSPGCSAFGISPPEPLYLKIALTLNAPPHNYSKLPTAPPLSRRPSLSLFLLSPLRFTVHSNHATANIQNASDPLFRYLSGKTKGTQLPLFYLGVCARSQPCWARQAGAQIPFINSKWTLGLSRCLLSSYTRLFNFLLLWKPPL